MATLCASKARTNLYRLIDDASSSHEAILITPPPFEKLTGDLIGAHSRRINIHNRLVYQVLDKEKVVKVIRMWTRYE